MNELEMTKSSRDAWMEKASVETARINIIKEVVEIFEIKKLNKIVEFIESLQDTDFSEGSKR